MSKETTTKKTIMFFSHHGGENHMTGAENYLYTMIKELKKQFRCILVCPIECMLTSEVRNLGIGVIVIPYPMMWSMWNEEVKMVQEKNRVFNDPSINIIKAVIQQQTPDLVVTISAVNPLPARAAKRLEIPVLWAVCEVISESSRTQEVIQIINKNSDFIVGISNAVVRPFKKRQLDRKVMMLTPTLERSTKSQSNIRYQLGLKKNEKLVGCLAAYFSPLKGFEHFIRMAIPLCKKIPHVHFLLVGKTTDKKYQKKCLQLIKASGFKNRFHIHPYVKDVQSIYQAVDLVVVPSLVDEGFSLVCLESLINGSPVVAYSSGGIIEQMKLTNNPQFLVRKGHIKGLEKKVFKLLQSPLMCSRIGKKNRKLALSFYGPDIYRSQLSVIMKKIIG